MKTHMIVKKLRPLARSGAKRRQNARVDATFSRSYAFSYSKQPFWRQNVPGSTSALPRLFLGRECPFFIDFVREREPFCLCSATIWSWKSWKSNEKPTISSVFGPPRAPSLSKTTDLDHTDFWRPYPTTRTSVPTPPSRAHPQDDVSRQATPSN